MKNKIIEVLRKHPKGLKAREISPLIPGSTKKMVNQILYANPSEFIAEDYIWKLKTASTTNKNHTTKRKNTIKKLEKMFFDLGYNNVDLDCYEEDELTLLCDRLECVKKQFSKLNIYYDSFQLIKIVLNSYQYMELIQKDVNIKKIASRLEEERKKKVWPTSYSTSKVKEKKDESQLCDEFYNAASKEREPNSWPRRYSSSKETNSTVKLCIGNCSVCEREKCVKDI